MSKMMRIFLIIASIVITLTMTGFTAVGNGLPPRPTPPPPPTPLPIVEKGGFIELQVTPVQADLWTQVQWLAGDGAWYDVDGWGGQLTDNNKALWYVGPELVGDAASFRWQVYDGKEGSLLATSELFSMPEKPGQLVSVTITIKGN